MILTANEILKQVGSGRIKISNFDPSRVTTNSYDVILGDTLIQYDEGILDPFKDNSHRIFKIPEEGYLMKSGEFLLGHTEEKIGSDFYVTLLHGRSGTARMGLFVHVTADLWDIGAYGKSTLQLYSTLPLKLYAGMKIAQVSFWQPKGEIRLYTGKYQGSEGPVASKYHQDVLIKAVAQ